MPKKGLRRFSRATATGSKWRVRAIAAAVHASIDAVRAVAAYVCAVTAAVSRCRRKVGYHFSIKNVRSTRPENYFDNL